MCFVLTDEQVAMRHRLAVTCRSDLVFNQIDFLVNHSTVDPLNPSIRNVVISSGKKFLKMFLLCKDVGVSPGLSSSGVSLMLFNPALLLFSNSNSY